MSWTSDPQTGLPAVAPSAGSTLRVGVSGASGLVGRHLCRLLAGQGATVVRLVRRPASSADEISWSPQEGRIEREKVDGLDAVVHLAGESIAGRWTTQRKAAILSSRVRGTRLLSATLAACRNRPVLVTASAIGYYGDRGEETVTEESSRGTGFLADVCEEWEHATEVARDAGCRVVHVRVGVVLSASGGALRAMLWPFRLGLGGPIGDGSQFMSWIGLTDVVRAFAHVLVCDGMQGAVNAVGPEPVRQREFAKVLGRLLRRPAVLPMPAAAVRLFLGEMGTSLLLAGARVLPRRLSESGFVFSEPDLWRALGAELRGADTGR